MLQIELWKRVLIWGAVALGLALALPNAFYTRVETHNDAVAAIDKGADPAPLADKVAQWPSWMPSSLVNLGLDLRGGAHLLAEVQVSDVYDARLEALWPEVRDVLRDARDKVGPIRLQSEKNGELRVRLVERADAVGEAVELVRGLARPVVSVTSAGASDIDVRAEGADVVVTLSEAEKTVTDDRTVRQSLEIIRRRVDEVGTREPTIQRQGTDRILIQVPGLGSAAELKEIIGTTAQLTFQPVVSTTSNPNQKPGAGNELLPDIENKESFYILEKAPVVTGEELTDAQPAFDRNGRPAVEFRFNPSGARAFGDYTADNIGSLFAIVLDNQVISAPVIQSHIPGGSGIITGNFTVESSTNLAVLLRAGALPAGLNFLEERTIGPELGADSIEAGKIACMVAFALVLVFMFLSYGLFGLFANIALIINVAMIFGALSLIGATLTLPGIAGIALTIGMAVDANVLIFERIREEMASRKNAAARAISEGYERALSAIVDANITTLITAAILYAVGSGPVRGFAVTLALGIITSVFTAIYVTRIMVVMWYDRKRPKTVQTGRYLRMVPAVTNWDFFGKAKFWVGVSAILIALSIGAFSMRGLNYGIDFLGGTTIRTESAEPIDIKTYRSALNTLDLGQITVAEVFDPTFGPDQNVAMVRIEANDDVDSASTELTEKVEAALKQAVPDIKFTSVESVGPKVSGELIQTAILAVSLAIAAVLFYIWLRFEWQFALGAVIALVHDVTLTIGIFSAFQIPFDLTIIAALLTIVGYSINDTVVVFDRVRENLRKFKTTPLVEVLNGSINETLSRTVMTSFTTLLALIALLVLGGDVIRGFVFAMTWGILVGTYSSVFVASNILLWLGVKRDWSKPDTKPGTQFGNVDA